MNLPYLPACQTAPAADANPANFLPLNTVSGVSGAHASLCGVAA